MSAGELSIIPEHVNEFTAYALPSQYMGRGGGRDDPTICEAYTTVAHD